MTALHSSADLQCENSALSRAKFSPDGWLSRHARRVGALAVTPLNDGFLFAHPPVILDLDLHVSRHMLEITGTYAASIALNAFLITLGGEFALVDSGGGPLIAPIIGNLPSQLERLGVAPEKIRYVLLTHLHPDHASGLLNRDRISAAYPNAEIILSREEARFWLEGDIDTRVTARTQRAIAEARRSLAPYRGRIRQVVDEEVLPGVRAVPLYGHTPGHTGWMIESQSERLLLWGDIVHFERVQTAYPQAKLMYDVDREAAKATRRRIFDFAADEALVVGGAHLTFPGFGRVLREGSAYRYQPAEC